MKRLLIVDDEELIVNGLFEIFSGLRDLDLDIYKAYSGQEAIDWLNRTRMDIVLTDIRMPEISGLQLLDEIVTRWPRCKVIFLTGHSEFEYIYEANQRGNVEYILKTEDNDKVIATVQKAIQALRDEDARDELIQKAKQQGETQTGTMIRDFFWHMLHGDLNSQNPQRQFETLGISLDPDAPTNLILGKINGLEEEPSYAKRFEVLLSVRHVIVRNFVMRVRCLALVLSNNLLCIFVQPITDEGTTTYIKGTLEAIQTSCQDALGAKVDFTYNDVPCAWTDTADQYQELHQMLSDPMGTELGAMLCNHDFQNIVKPTEETSEQIKDLEAVLRHSNIKQMRQLLEGGKQQPYEMLMDSILTPLSEIETMSAPIALEAYQTLSLMLLSHINRWKLHAEIKRTMDIQFLMNVNVISLWKEGVVKLKALSTLLFSLQKEEQKRRIDNTVEFVESYIKTHLSEDLSLVVLAELVFLNPSYLSRFYKQITGINISEFIEVTRLTAAKTMLEEGTKKIHEIASAVGYDTATSFTRFFRKGTGMSPQEYKENCVSVKIRQQNQQ